MRDGVATIPTTLIIRSCYDEWVDPRDCYSFLSFLRSHHRRPNNDFLLVVSPDQHGATTLVSGVEEIDTPLEDLIVHLSPPYLEVEPR